MLDHNDTSYPHSKNEKNLIMDKINPTSNPTSYSILSTNITSNIYLLPLSLVVISILIMCTKISFNFKLFFIIVFLDL